MRFVSFNPAMLAAVRAGRKTVTRRRLPPDLAVQQQPGCYCYRGLIEAGAVFEQVDAPGPLPPVPCPFGLPGTVLAVPEDPALRLQVLSIRAEQAQCLTDADAVAEGVYYSLERPGLVVWGGVEPDPVVPETFCWYASPRAAFQGLLNSIYPAAWARNEWVWVIEFRRLS